MIGLGGGSLAKYCYKYLPDVSITAVEIDPEVIAVGDQFFMPPEDDRFEIVCDDGAAFVKRDAGTCDVLRSEEHTSELQSLMRISYAVFCLKKKNNTHTIIRDYQTA